MLRGRYTDVIFMRSHPETRRYFFLCREFDLFCEIQGYHAKPAAHSPGLFSFVGFSICLKFKIPAWFQPQIPGVCFRGFGLARGRPCGGPAPGGGGRTPHGLYTDVLHLGPLLTAGRLRPTAAELLAARLRPTVCGQRPSGFCTAATGAATHRLPSTANGRRAPTRPPAANSLRPSAAGLMHNRQGGCFSPQAVDGLGSYPPVCGQLCAASGRRAYASLALGVRCTQCRIRQTAAELLPARLRPAVCGQRPPGFRTAATLAGTHILPCAANGRRARTRPFAANCVRPTSAGVMHLLN